MLTEKKTTVPRSLLSLLPHGIAAASLISAGALAVDTHSTNWSDELAPPAPTVRQVFRQYNVEESGDCPAWHALHFDGESSEVISDANFDTSHLTVEAWVYVESVSQPFNFGGLVQWGRQWHAAWEVMLVGYAAGGTNTTTHVYPYQAFNWNTPEYVYMFSPQVLIPMETWAHVAMTYDGNVGRTYINGELSDQQTLGQPILPATGESWLSIANNFPGGPEYVGGIIDEVRIWSVVRSQAEIQHTMNRPLSGDEPGLMAYYQFDAGVGDFIADHSGNGRHAMFGSNANPNAGDPTWTSTAAPLNTLGELNDDATVDVLDLLILLDSWGSCPGGVPCAADLNGDGVVNEADLILLLANWGC